MIVREKGQDMTRLRVRWSGATNFGGGITSPNSLRPATDADKGSSGFLAVDFQKNH